MSEQGTAGVGKRLREAREAKGYSRLDLARLSGVAEKTITKAEGRASAPDANNLLLLAKALGEDPWRLVFGSTLQTSAASADDLSETVSELRAEVQRVEALLGRAIARQEDAAGKIERRLTALESQQGRRERRAG